MRLRRFLDTGIYALIFITFLFTAASCYADQRGFVLIEKYASEACVALEKMIGPKKGGFTTAILPFYGYQSDTVAQLNNYKNQGNSDERCFEDCLFEQLVISRNFRVFTRNKLDKALKELELQITDLFDPDTAKRVGKFIGAELIVLMEGYIGSCALATDFTLKRCFELDGGHGTFRVKVLAIDVETAEVRGIWKKFVKNPR